MLAGQLGERETAFARRADEAFEKCFHVDHDLEANGFFVDLAHASSPLAFQGLHSWLGEAAARALYRRRGARLSPDGCGRYLHQGGEITFFLEWDRATESPHRLRRKVGDYIDHFGNRANADLFSVLFVVPSEAREAVVGATIQSRIPQSARTCGFFTTTTSRLRAAGPLGPVFTPADDRRRLSLTQLPAHPRSGRQVTDCVGKPRWWERRPGGAEVA